MTSVNEITEFKRLLRKEYRRVWYKENKQRLAREYIADIDNRRKLQREYIRRNWAKRCLYDSRVKDKKVGCYVSDTHVTEGFLLELRCKQDNMCYLCGIEMATGVDVNRKTTPDALTLGRLNMWNGHSKTNCVLLCGTCNRTGSKCKHKHMRPRKYKIEHRKTCLFFD